MQKIALNSLEDLKPYKDDYGYHFPGNAVFNCNSYIQGRLKVDGYIKSRKSIQATGYIKSLKFIEVGGFIKTNDSIKSGSYIKADRFISAGSSITAESSITAGSFIKSDENIHSGWSIKSNNYIKADGFIESGWSIQSGDGYGISAGVYITCENGLKSGQKIFAGTCVWGELDDRDKTITCEKLISGVVEYGILKETGKEEDTIEMTLKEVAQKLGVDVEKLRIKDEE